MNDTEILAVRNDTADHLRQTLLEEIVKFAEICSECRSGPFIHVRYLTELIKKKCV